MGQWEFSVPGPECLSPPSPALKPRPAAGLCLEVGGGRWEVIQPILRFGVGLQPSQTDVPRKRRSHQSRLFPALLTRCRRGHSGKVVSKQRGDAWAETRSGSILSWTCSLGAVRSRVCFSGAHPGVSGRPSGRRRRGPHPRPAVCSSFPRWAPAPTCHQKSRRPPPEPSSAKHLVPILSHAERWAAPTRNRVLQSQEGPRTW